MVPNKVESVEISHAPAAIFYFVNQCYLRVVRKIKKNEEIQTIESCVKMKDKKDCKSPNIDVFNLISECYDSSKAYQIGCQ